VGLTKGLVVAKRSGRPPRDTDKIQGFAMRRGGANYQDAYRAAKSRLKQLAKDFENVPKAYQGFVLVGICTAMESHLKYFYAHATDRYASHPNILLKLLKDVNVDIATIISISTSSFQLSDVVAATISVSTLDAYLAKASDFITVVHGEEHNFPWSYQEIFTETDSEFKKQIGLRLERLRTVFDARHRLVHETNVPDYGGDHPLEGLEAHQIIEDALWLMGQFEQIYWESEFNPDLNPKSDLGLPASVDEADNEIDAVFAKMESDIEERQSETLRKFKTDFKEYLWSRAGFLASAFIAQRSEETMGYYLELVPQYLPVLNRIFLEQHFLRAKFPTARQEFELLNPSMGDDDSSSE
jgi:hypothetical protein